MRAGTGQRHAESGRTKKFVIYETEEYNPEEK